MQKKDTTDQLNQLIDLGKEKGFLTHDEINDLLPSDNFSQNQIDDMRITFGDMNIEIIEARQKVKTTQPKLQKFSEEPKTETNGTGMGGGMIED